MALPFLMPRDQVNEEQYRRLEQLLCDLYSVLNDLITGGDGPQPAIPIQHQPPQPPPPPPPAQGPTRAAIPHRGRRTPRGPQRPVQPVRVNVVHASAPRLAPQTSMSSKFSKTSDTMALQLGITGAVSVLGAGQQPAAPA